jgi:carbon-monoxide dehydrogenase medium subunit
MLRIGAATPHRVVAADPLVHQYLQGLADAVAGIGSPRIRVQGTIGGNVMSGAPHYDILPMLLALSARLTFLDAGGATHDVGAEQGLPDDPHSLLQTIAIPVDRVARRFLFERIDKPVISLAASVSEKSGNATVVRVVLACAGRSPLLRTLEIEAANGQAIADAAAAWRASLPEIPDDRIASAWYRAELAQVRLRRLLTAMLGIAP